MSSERSMTRREALELIGMTAAAAAAPLTGFAQAGAKPAFPKGAIIRTVLKDAPEELAGGATLFYEHWLAVTLGEVRCRHGGPWRRTACRLARRRPWRAPALRPPDIMHDVDLMAAEVESRQRRLIALSSKRVRRARRQFHPPGRDEIGCRL